MSHHSDRWGIFRSITSRKQALEAVKMSGLPLLLLAVSTIVGVLPVFTELLPAPIFGLLLFLLFGVLPALLFLWGAFGLRAMRWRRVPWLCGAAALVILCNAVLFPSWSFFVQFGALMLLVNGVRGWHWLRRNPS